MNRRDFQELAAIRLKEARVLLKAQCWEGAYYLGGYAVECALKACIAKQTMRHDFPDKELADSSYTHDLEKLLKLAELEAALRESAGSNRELQTNWNVVRDWKEHSRYSKPSQADADKILLAIGDRQRGVLGWLRRHW